MNDYPIDAWLRPPVELYSATVFLGSSLVCVLAPWSLMMSAEIGYTMALILGYMGYERTQQALWVLRYQRNIRRVPGFSLRPDQIPVSLKKMYLGLGFRWTQKHTQRLKDTQRPEVEAYIRPPPHILWVRKKEVQWEHTPVMKALMKITARPAWWNPVAPYPPVGGLPQLHAVEPNEERVYSDLGERVGHTLVLGTTRVGKTRLAEILITQDIHRGGNAVIVFDPKGDAELLRRIYLEAKRAGRLDKLYVFHLGHPDISARYNPVGDFSRITEVASRISRQLPGEGQSAAFREFVWRYVNVIAKAANALGRRIDYDMIMMYGQDIEPLLIDYLEFVLTQKVGNEDWQAPVQTVKRMYEDGDLKVPRQMKDRSNQAHALIKYARDMDVIDLVASALLKTFEYDKSYFDKLVASLLPLMEKLTTGAVAELISPNYLDADDPRPIFDWKQVITSESIVYVGLDALTDSEVAAAVGNSMFADLTSQAGKIYKHGLDIGMPENEMKNSPENKTVTCIHADEFNELMGDEFIPLLNKAGGANFQVTAYTQVWADVEARVGSKAKASQVAGNFNTLIMLRVKDEETAEMLTTQLPRVEIQTLMQVSGTNDSSDPGSDVDFTSRNEDRISVTQEAMLEANMIMALPKGQAFAMLEGGNLWKIRMPLPDDSGDEGMPKELQAISNDMRQRYRTSDNWWQLSDETTNNHYFISPEKKEKQTFVPVKTRCLHSGGLGADADDAMGVDD
ncbi:MAG: type IV conjugative transfer system coupling protein TraD [gamma proteobacterium symbiont of Lucinoma myriamae]|nr:type IV conjugative transfer system coupling protein TraD [gamma proteobacterium symbiont of Lucinoma myriamae]MCU7833208.1 type IV conjugative transfer system coupling protein TraD [gamma proteobacterium symbiont of Lucinoma myriamae]